MWAEYLSEIVPGVVILGSLLLWWQAHTDLCALKLKWSEFVSTLAEAESWDEASSVLKEYAQDSDA